MNDYKINNICIIVPAYNESNNVALLKAEIDNVFANIESVNYSILYVNDCSSDDTLEQIKQLANQHANVNYVSFSRNFGKEAAIFAGLSQAHKMNFSHYLLMDCDLQDPPSMVPDMINRMNENQSCDCVCARRTSRKGEGIIKSLLSKMFYSVINKVSSIKLKSGVRDFRLMTKQYVEAILSCGEYNRFFKGITSWIGFNVEWFEYENKERNGGKSKWSIASLFKYAIQGIIAYTTWPLSIIAILGLVMSFVAFIFLVIVVVRALIAGDPVAGWPSLTCILLFLGGLLLLSLGIIGLYFEKMYTEVKKRPIYIIKEKHLNN